MPHLLGRCSRPAGAIHIRSDNGPEFIAAALREWLSRLGVKTLYIEPGSPWENGYNEPFSGCEAAREALCATSS